MNALAIEQSAESRDPPSAALPNLAEVYASQFRYVWRCLRSVGVRDAQLDDALQDVFIVVHRRLREFDCHGDVRTWLYAIALNIARKYRERARREPTSLEEARELTPELPASDENVDASLHRERLALARCALAALDDEKREVFVLARVEQMSAPEIARVLKIPVNTVYSRLRAARLAFEAEVKRLRAGSGSTP